MIQQNVRQIVRQAAEEKWTSLSLSGSQLLKLPPAIRQLETLQELYLHSNQLTALPPEIGQLKNLQHLSVYNNQLSQLPAEIGQLSQLEELDLRHNQLRELPREMGQLMGLKRLFLQNNPLEIPPEIVEKTDDPAVIISYYLQLRAEPTKPLNEAKMLLVGQGSVGKTSLVNCLLRQPFNRHESKTEGINIQRWTIQPENRTVQLNVWDFGGQEIMHATHQFFLSQRSLYLLVLNARLGEEENRLEYWLKIIQSFGGDSPVIVVGNQVDQQRLDLDRQGLQEKYPAIHAFVETSCATGEGIDNLRTLIANKIGQLEHLNSQLPLSWFEVKEELEQLQQDYIPYAEYIQICRSKGIVNEDNQRTLIGFLHDLGVMLNFQDDRRLEDTNILNPVWVTNGVYQILNDNALITKHKGILAQSMLDLILDSQEYPRDRQLFVVDMMRKFELCFDLEAGSNPTFLIPDLLSKEEPYTGEEWQEALAFQYHYPVLPSSIISRFIVRTNQLVHQKTYWRSGVVLAYEENRALIKADREEKKISIRVSGPQTSRRTLLAIIRSHFHHIHQTLASIEVAEKVPLPERSEILLDYQDLLTLERMGEAKYLVPKLQARVSVQQLLDGIEPASERKKLQRDLASPTITVRNPSPWRSGMFYLFALSVNTALFAVVYHYLGLVALPVVAIAALLSITVIGALQLRQDEKLSDKSFGALMVEALKRLPLLKQSK